jgi:hypothetical protein
MKWEWSTWNEDDDEVTKDGTSKAEYFRDLFLNHDGNESDRSNEDDGPDDISKSEDLLSGLNLPHL